MVVVEELLKIEGEEMTGVTEQNWSGRAVFGLVGYG